MRRPMTQQTQANKARRAAKRGRRLEAASNRRFSDTWIDPMTGKKATKFQMSGIREIRLQQQMKINKKRDQRRAFSRLSPAQKAQHRAAAPMGARTRPKRQKIIQPVRQWKPLRMPDLTNILTG